MEDSRENCLPENSGEERKVGEIDMEVCLVGEKVSSFEAENSGVPKDKELWKRPSDFFTINAVSLSTQYQTDVL